SKVQAGPKGCALLRVGPQAFARLLPETGLGAKMYGTLRQRFAWYSWSWLKRSRRGEGRKSVGRDASDKTIEHLCRALLVALTVEAEDGRGSAVVLVTPVELGEILRNQLSEPIRRSGKGLFGR